MIDTILGRLPSSAILLSAFLTVVIPLIIYKINQKLHQVGDPPWKRSNK